MTRIEAIRQLRQTHNVSIQFAREAYDASQGDMTQAAIYIKANWQGNQGKSTECGLIYTHHHPHDIPRIGVMLEVRCGTDFVAKGEDFKKLCKELALQLVSGLEEPLEEQKYVRDSSRTVKDLINEYSQRLGEAIVVHRHARWELGDE